MKRFLPFILIACIVIGCNKENKEPQNNAAVIFDIDFLATKAQSQNEKNINLLQVGIYNANGDLEWDNIYRYSFTTIKTVAGLLEGPKTIVAVANKEFTMPASLEEFYRIRVSLKENRKDAFVMVGSEQTEASVDPKLTTIRLKRTVAKISLRASISTQWIDEKPHTFDPQRIYIANAATETNLRGDAFKEFINPREPKEPTLTTDENLKEFTVANKQSWQSGDVFNGGVDFYVCPNTDTTKLNKTAMIIEALFDNQKCYYPLIVADTIACNTMYRCNTIVISCVGMPTPVLDFTSIRVNYDYATQAWDSCGFKPLVPGEQKIIFK